jgi:hypothetical protein
MKAELEGVEDYTGSTLEQLSNTFKELLQKKINDL